MKSIKGVIKRNVTKPTSVNIKDNRRPIGERCLNPPRFKPMIIPRGSLRTWGTTLSSFRGPLLCISLIEVVQRMKHLNNVNYPPLMTDPLINPNKYYVFHKGMGHWTRYCIHPKWKIKHMFSEGYLGDIVNRTWGP